ncbi:MAG: hypothetical protein LZF63_12365 [Nitrosomonas sp.]|uniref:hypothetical protein n=1 Tax=Nitrosomonas sp. TaxID=42353 RepID=UPI0025F94254|nr:hypothetical protein [Nitrosomonas sp.]MCG7757437.1 hypothetical protein [Nitrosomonas sp.]UJP03720.1 MAG: hypothetical protein LZF85_04525 [Nitrosomonas sp.]
MMKILFTMIISGFLFISVPAFASGYSQTQNNVDGKKDSSKPAQSNPANKNGGKESQSEAYGKQKVEKLEKDEGRYQQLKKDADPRGRTEENKGNFDENVPQ